MSYLVKDYMKMDVVTVDVGASALAVSKLMADKNIGYIIVLDKSQPTGIVTEKDLVMKVIAKEKNSSTVKVSEIMSTPLITVNLDATVEDAIKLMAKHRIRRVVVIRNNVIYGVFTTRDLTANFSKYQNRVTRDLMNAQTIYGATELTF
jgi:CBS domain-containing protein